MKNETAFRSFSLSLSLNQPSCFGTSSNCNIYEKERERGVIVCGHGHSAGEWSLNGGAKQNWNFIPLKALLWKKPTVSQANAKKEWFSSGPSSCLCEFSSMVFKGLRKKKKHINKRSITSFLSVSHRLDIRSSDSQPTTLQGQGNKWFMNVLFVL